MYAKLINGELIPAPNKIEKDGMLIVNPRGDLLKQLGYKEIIIIDESTIEPVEGDSLEDTVIIDNGDKIAIPNYTELADKIEVRYTYEDKVIPTISYEERVISLIREKYSVDDELAIIRQKDTKPEEFNTYFSFVEDCKANIKELNN